jgi:hypothetical protein
LRTINATIKEIRHYDPRFRPKTLPLYTLDQIASGEALRKSCFLLEVPSGTYAVSKWTGPKRSRTYPYQHVYDTIARKPRVAIIPYYKDEGTDGNSDYLQWDTVSLMSLLNVYVILSYHSSAQPNRRNPNKRRITGHALDTAYIRQRLEELALYHSDPIHWNMKELNENLLTVMQRTLLHHEQIEAATGVRLHGRDGLIQRIDSVESYRQDSRARALLAQGREQTTIQPGERIENALKASINITNFFNGEYHLTVDEVVPLDQTLFLIEKKHSSKQALPATGDIKDGLLKLILYANLDSAEFDAQVYTPRAVLGLTSDIIQGWCHNRMNSEEQAAFFAMNPSFNAARVKTIHELFEEANANRLFAYFSNSELDADKQTQLLSDLLTRQ